MKMTSPTEGSLMDFDPYNSRSAADPSHNLAGLVELNDYRAFRYGKAGAANTSQGKLEIAPAPIANHANMAVLAAANGAFIVNCTPGATGGAVSIYDEGIASINAGPGAGQDYTVSHNPTITSATAFNLTLSDPINVALTTSSKLTLVHNAWNGFVESATQTRRACGVGLINLTAAFEGWLQTKGIASVLADGAIAVGSLIAPSSSVAGAVVIDSSTYATALATTQIGQASIIAGVDTEYRPMVLTID